MGSLLKSLYRIGQLEKAALRDPQVLVGLNQFVIALNGGLEVRNGLRPLLLLRQDRPLAVMGFGVLRPQCNNLIETFQGLVRTAGIGVQHAHVLARVHVLAVQGKGLFITFQRLVQPLHLAQGITLVVMGGSQSGLKGDGPVVACDGVFGPRQLLERDPPVDVGFCEIWAQAGGTLKMRQCFVMALQSAQSQPTIDVRRSIIRSQLDGLADQVHRNLQVTRLVRQNALHVQGANVFGVILQNGVVELVGLRNSALLVCSHGLVQPRSQLGFCHLGRAYSEVVVNAHDPGCAADRNAERPSPGQPSSANKREIVTRAPPRSDRRCRINTPI